MKGSWPPALCSCQGGVLRLPCFWRKLFPALGASDSSPSGPSIPTPGARPCLAAGESWALHLTSEAWLLTRTASVPAQASRDEQRDATRESAHRGQAAREGPALMSTSSREPHVPAGVSQVPRFSASLRPWGEPKRAAPSDSLTQCERSVLAGTPAGPAAREPSPPTGTWGSRLSYRKIHTSRKGPVGLGKWSPKTLPGVSQRALRLKRKGHFGSGPEKRAMNRKAGAARWGGAGRKERQRSLGVCFLAWTMQVIQKTCPSHYFAGVLGGWYQIITITKITFSTYYMSDTVLSVLYFSPQKNSKWEELLSPSYR